MKEIISSPHPRIRFINFRKISVIFLFVLTAKNIYSVSPKKIPDFFAGLGASLYFPSFSAKQDGASGFGGGAFLEAGLEYKNFQTEAILGYSGLSSGGGFLQKMGEFKIGLGAAYVLDSRNIKFMPQFIAVRPHISAFADFYNAKLYKNAVQMSEDMLSEVNGVTPVFNVGVFTDFPKLLYVAGYNIVPNIGFEECFRFDVSGLYATPILTLGTRIHFGNRKLPVNENDIHTEQIEESVPAINDTPELSGKIPDVQDEIPPLQDAEPLITTPLPIFEPVLFIPNSAEPIEFYDKTFEKISLFMQENPSYTLKILGYSSPFFERLLDNYMEENYLKRISQLRAENVKKLLEKLGIKAERLIAQGKGTGGFDRTNDYQNRRVEFELVNKTEE